MDPNTQSTPTPNTPTAPSAGDSDQRPIMPSATLSEPTESTLKPNKKKLGRKKLVAAIIIAVLLAIFGGAYAAYALWYNTPAKVTDDALKSVMTAKSATFSGKLEFAAPASEGVTGQVTLDFDGQSDEQNSQINVKSKINLPPFSVDFGTSFITSGAGDIYFKIDNAKGILNNYAAMLGGDASAFKGVTDMLDNKWVKVTQADLKELNPDGDDQQLTCLQKAVTDFNNNKAQQDQLFKAFTDNRFVTVGKQLGSAKIGNSMSNGYELAFDNQKAESFGKAAEQTDFVKALNKCVGDQATNESSESKSEGATPDVKLEVWADQWSHQMTRFKVTTEDEEVGKVTFNIDQQLNKPVKVTLPTDNVTQFKDLKAEFEKLFSPAALMQSPSATAEAFQFES